MVWGRGAYLGVGLVEEAEGEEVEALLEHVHVLEGVDCEGDVKN